MYAWSNYEVQADDKAGIFLEPSGAIVVRLAHPHDPARGPAVRVPKDHIEWLYDLVDELQLALTVREAKV